MSVLKTVGSVEGGDAIREKAERISDGLGGEWEVYTVGNDGGSAVLRHARQPWTQPEEMLAISQACRRIDPRVRASVSVSAYEQCLYAKLRWPRSRCCSRWPTRSELAAISILTLRIATWSMRT